MKKRKIIMMLCLFVMTISIASCKGKSGGEMVMNMTPQIDQNGADPWILLKDSMYYYTKTTGNNVTIYRSNHISDVAAGEEKVVFSDAGELKSFWAPEMHYLDNAWYVYFAATPSDSDIHRTYVLSNNNEDPFEGEWKCEELIGMDDKFAIDGTILQTNHERYFLWSGWEGYENVRQDIYIARMISPTEIKKEKVLLSKPDYEWEKSGQPYVNEGPQIVVKNDMVNLVYSASGSWTNDYCLGLLTIPSDGDMMNSSAWEKAKEPIFSSANGIYGPGHNGFTTSPDGNEDYLVYHSARWDGSGWNRSIRIQQIQFDDTGKLIAGEPHDSDAYMDVPSGEPGRLRFSNTGTAVQGSMECSFDLPEAGEYTVFVYAKIEDYIDEQPAFGVIEINDEVFTEELCSSEYYQPIIVRSAFKKGKNVISVSFDTSDKKVEIGRIEVMAVAK